MKFRKTTFVGLLLCGMSVGSYVSGNADMNLCYTQFLLGLGMITGRAAIDKITPKQ